MKTIQWVWRISVLLVLVVLGVVLIFTIQKSIQTELEPLRDVQHGLATQVSGVLHPTPTIIPDPVTIIHEVRSLARLETIKFSVEKIITAETRQGAFEFFLGDELIFVAHGEVIAGVDLDKLGSEDLEIRNGVLYVRLPESEVFATILDNEQSYVYDRDKGLFTKGDVNLETEARRAAEREIYESALEDDILDLAKLNAESFLARLFRDLGYPEVIFEQ